MNTHEYNVGLAWAGGRKGLIFSREITASPSFAEGIEVLSPVVGITDESQRELAGKVLQRSEKACLISNSIKSKVTVQSSIQVSERYPILSVS